MDPEDQVEQESTIDANGEQAWCRHIQETHLNWAFECEAHHFPEHRPSTLIIKALLLLIEFWLARGFRMPGIRDRSKSGFFSDERYDFAQGTKKGVIKTPFIKYGRGRGFELPTSCSQ